MFESLEEAFKEVAQLPEDEQRHIVEIIRQELASEKRWQALFHDPRRSARNNFTPFSPNCQSRCKDRLMKPIGSFELTPHIRACLLSKSVLVVLSIQYA